MQGYLQGHVAALTQLGITKEASRASFLGRLGRGVQKRMPTWSGTKKFMVGEPRRFGEEIVGGKALRKGSLIRESFAAPDKLSKALLYGLPAVEAGGIALDEEGEKGRRLGGMAGGLALGYGAYRPLGLVGSTILGTAGHGIGERIGAGVESLAGGDKPEAGPIVDPNQINRYARHGLRRGILASGGEY